MLTEDYTGQAGTEVKLTYDSCTNGIGYLCTASSTGSFASSTYDILGRVATSSVTINNLSYSMAYSYDRQGNVKVVQGLASANTRTLNAMGYYDDFCAKFDGRWLIKEKRIYR